jgi:hypothetical protein
MMIRMIPMVGLVVGNTGVYSKIASDVLVVAGVVAVTVAVAVALEVAVLVIFLWQ